MVLAPRPAARSKARLPRNFVRTIISVAFIAALTIMAFGQFSGFALVACLVVLWGVAVIILVPNVRQKLGRGLTQTMIGLKSATTSTTTNQPATSEPVSEGGDVPAVEPRDPPASKRKQTPGSQSKQERKRYELPQVTPSQGLHGLVWNYLGGKQLYARFGWQWLTRLSLRERYTTALDLLWELRKVQKIVAIANTKGGSGKTLLATWLSAMYAFALKIPPLAFDVNESPGGTAKRLGVDREHTLQLRTLIRRRNELRLPSKLLLEADRHRETGVVVVASEKASIESFSQEDFEETLEILGKQFPIVFCDFGNDPLRPGNLGSLKKAHAVVLPENIHMADADEDLISTMLRYSEVDNGAYATKVQNAIIVVIGERRLYNWFRTQRRREEYAARYGVRSENLFVIPFNRYMKKGKLVTLKRVPLRVRVVLLETLVAIIAAPILEAAKSHVPGVNSTDSEQSGEVSPMG